MEQKEMRKTKLLYNLEIVLWGVLTGLLAVLIVLELIPAPTSGLEVKETVKVSAASLSPFDAEVKDYTCSVAGVLANPSDTDVTVDAVRVTVSDGKNNRVLELEGFVLPARSTRELSLTFEDTVGYDRVQEVAVMSDGAEDILPNQTNSGLEISGVLVFYLICAVVSVLLLVRACKRRCYLQQEIDAQ
ncbi:MAG: hypothetical protein IJW55_09285 [Clostridia bacterium]|nr:hypothetical protein [Clostridia bacterium]